MKGIGFLKGRNPFGLTNLCTVCLTTGSAPASHTICVWGGSSLHGATMTVALQLTNSCTQTQAHIRVNKPGKGHMMAAVAHACFHVYLILIIGDTNIGELFVLDFGANGLLQVESQLVPEACNYLHVNKEGK